jgi:hypothetical protein
MRYTFLQDNKYDFTKLNAKSEVQGKSLKQTFLDNEAQTEILLKGTSTLIKDHAKNTQFFKDGVEGNFPIDAFQILDLTVNLPLNKYWAQELMPIRYGGGANESIAFYRTNIELTQGRLAGGNTNSVPVVGVQDQKITGPIYPIIMGIILGQVDLMKAETINYDLLERHENALRTSYWREIEFLTFLGNEGLAGIDNTNNEFRPGLFNIPTTGFGIGYTEVQVPFAVLDVAGWTTVLVGAVADIKNKVRQNRDYFPNTIALGPNTWTLMQQPAVVGVLAGASGTGIAQSIMDYVKRQIKDRLQVEVDFVEIPYLQDGAIADYGYPIEASGANHEDRIVIYRKDEKAIKLPITMPLTGGAIMPSPTEGGFRKNYLAFAGPMLLVYPETIHYIDNINGNGGN